MRSGERAVIGADPAQQRAWGWGWKTGWKEFRGKKFALSPTGTGEPPAGHKQGVT